MTHDAQKNRKWERYGCLLPCRVIPQSEADMIVSARIINIGRGGLVDEGALADALAAGKLFAAGLDVVSTEPIQPDNPLLSAKNCIITPHISWASRESRTRLMKIAAENARLFLAGTPVNVVN